MKEKVPRKEKIERKFKHLPKLDPEQIDLFVDWYGKHHGNITEFRAQSVEYRYKKLQEFVRSLNWKDRQYKLKL